MRLTYFGLLFWGTLVSANAAETNGYLFPSEHDSSSNQEVRRVLDDFSRSRYGKNDESSRTGLSFGDVSQLSFAAGQKSERIPATDHPAGSGNLLVALVEMKRLKRIEFNAENYKVTLRSDAASMETDHLRITLRSGSTSMMWSTAF